MKPANLFACRLGLDVDFLKVLDFGLVKVQGPRAAAAEELTAAGSFTGTPAFMPPEVALGGEAVDARADIYALGCVAYWLLTGPARLRERQRDADGDRPRAHAAARRRRGAPPRPSPRGWSGSSCAAWPRIPPSRPASAAALSRELQMARHRGALDGGEGARVVEARDDGAPVAGIARARAGSLDAAHPIDARPRMKDMARWNRRK